MVSFIFIYFTCSDNIVEDWDQINSYEVNALLYNGEVNNLDEEVNDLIENNEERI